MATPIGDQMHKCLLEAEVERYAKSVEEYEKNPSSEKPRKRASPKPWKRPGKLARCQDFNLLKLVNEFDFDLADPEFQAFCDKRAVLHVAGDLGGKYWSYFADLSKRRSDFINDKEFQTAVRLNGNAYRYTPDEMDALWNVVHLGRAQLQDLWEVFVSVRGSR